jgi:hypothetical protein
VHPNLVHRENFKKKFDVNDLFYPDKRIKDLGNRESFIVLNLAEKMMEQATIKKIFFHGFQNTLIGKGHWNEKGHEFAGKEISKTICKNFNFLFFANIILTLVICN